MEKWIWVIPVVLAVLSLLSKGGKAKGGTEAQPAEPTRAQRIVAAARQAAAAAAADPRLAAAFRQADTGPPQAVLQPVQRAPRPQSAPVPPRPAVPAAPRHGGPPAAASPAAVSPVRRLVLDALGDPARARAAVVLAEVLAPPVALR